MYKKEKKMINNFTSGHQFSNFIEMRPGFYKIFTPFFIL